MVSAGQIRRDARKYQINAELSQLPKFMPLNPHHIYHINRSTPSMLLHNLIRLARTTSRFTIDTEKDVYLQVPSLIQIEFIRNESIIILIEVCHLPHESSVLFWLIRSLLKVILDQQKIIFSWGDLTDELMDFCPTPLFSSTMLQTINYIDVQHNFKVWCHRTFSEDDLMICIQNNLVRDYASITNDEINHKWSLQMAIAFAFDEFLDKSSTKCNWSRPLDVMLVYGYMVRKRSDRHVLKMIDYAVNDCLAVTKLVRTLGLGSVKEQNLLV